MIRKPTQTVQSDKQNAPTELMVPIDSTTFNHDGLVCDQYGAQLGTKFEHKTSSYKQPTLHNTSQRLLLAHLATAPEFQLRDGGCRHCQTRTRLTGEVILAFQQHEDRKRLKVTNPTEKLRENVT
jgi:hypothetical protein